jgi:hypothetical protein
MKTKQLQPLDAEEKALLETSAKETRKQLRMEKSKSPSTWMFLASNISQ